jgi:ABC-type dipeptide/oligopeptide/nickel transport system permease component
MHRTEYVLKRIAFALMTVFVAITINFLLFHALPGSAVTSALRSPHASPELRATLTHEFGLDKSLFQQYVLYLNQLFFHANNLISLSSSGKRKESVSRESSFHSMISISWPLIKLKMPIANYR